MGWSFPSDSIRVVALDAAFLATGTASIGTLLRRASMLDCLEPPASLGPASEELRTAGGAVMSAGSAP
jgi:hypothetical protein